jgi:ribonuclease HII
MVVDGNQLPREWKSSPQCFTLVKGDQQMMTIAAASILAKVERDRLLAELGRRYPGYGFEQHAGYPTPLHQQALKTLGVTPEHRRSFGPVRKAL